MAWRKKAPGKITIINDHCATADLPAKLAECRAEKWMVLHVFWDGVEPGLITICKLRSAAYEPKPAKVAKKAPKGTAEGEALKTQVSTEVDRANKSYGMLNPTIFNIS